MWLDGCGKKKHIKHNKLDIKSFWLFKNIMICINFHIDFYIVMENIDES